MAGPRGVVKCQGPGWSQIVFIVDFSKTVWVRVGDRDGVSELGSSSKLETGQKDRGVSGPGSGQTPMHLLSQW